MLSFVIHLFFLLHLSIIAKAAATPPYEPIDHFLINCGSSSDIGADGRKWDGDTTLKFLPPNSAARALEADSSVFEVPYMTARIFHYQFTYTFLLSQGPKFLRLHFYPATYSGGFNKTQSFFAVTANGYTLLNNFSAFLTVNASNPPRAFLVKEFIINVEDNKILNVTFSPSSNSYSFVNGIEIVSMPNDLYFVEHDTSNPLKDISTGSMFNLDKNKTAFETLYRLNVGGPDVPRVGDTGMFREWSEDGNFIYGAATGKTDSSEIDITYKPETPSYTAPEIVYNTLRYMGNDYSLIYNLTWNFTVDSGFHYMFRLHFCDFISDNENQRVFTIFIANKTAEPVFDIIYNSHGKGIPIIREYVLLVHDPHGRKSKQDIWLALHPYLGTHPDSYDALLNGLEILKINSPDGSLAGPNPELIETLDTPPPNSRESKKKNKSRTSLYVVVGVVIGVAGMLLIIVSLILWRRKWMKDPEYSAPKSSPISSRSAKTSNEGSSLPSDLCRRFSLEELKFATAQFDQNFVIGTGGFGSVYKGHIDNGVTSVAIKRLNIFSNQGVHEFRTEIEMLSKLRHLHILSLIGYCHEQGEMILVYDYMANGTLRDHLYKTVNPPMPWKQRLQICIGAAKGLHYLHTGAKHNIIHRDVKSTNILLDEKWVAKVSDFGLSKVGPTGGISSHVSTMVKGSLGYVDPEYYKRQQLTDKSDVYSFGVVLFEVLCARPVIIPSLPREQVNLAEWARHSYRNGTLDEVLDPNLKGKIAPECLRSYAEIAVSCLKDRGIERPAMNEVVWNLEFALQLQEAAETKGNSKNPEIPLLLRGGEEITTTDDEVLSGSAKTAEKSKSNSSGTTTSGSSRLQPETVSSEIMNEAGG